MNLIKLADLVDVKTTKETINRLINETNTKVPDAPTTDGTYTLKVVVTNGTPTYQWVLDI